MGNPLASIVGPQRIRTIDEARLRERLGALEDRDLRRAIEDGMLHHLGIALDAADDA